MKIERTFLNDVSDEKVIKAEFSAQEILEIFSKTNEYTDYVCHALYSYIKAKIAKKGNPLNREGVCMGQVSDKFSYHALSRYEEYNFPNERTMSYQVMEWLQTQLGIDTESIYSHLGDCDEIYVKYFKGSRLWRPRQGRIILLKQIAEKQNVPNLQLVISDI